MENLPRWIFASIADHFKTIADTNNIPFFVEGVDEQEPEDTQQSHVELRSTGPDMKEVSKDFYTVEVVINFMVTSLMDMTGNAYEIFDWCGILAKEMQNPIPIYKYGNGVDDDDSLIGCLRVKKNSKDSVKVWHFGQIHKTDRVRQSEIDAAYEMDIKSDEL
jgi:hypothetical protein